MESLSARPASPLPSFIEGVREKVKRIDMPAGLMDRITARLAGPGNDEK